MNHQRTPRLKPLLDTVPPGFMVDTPWLKAQGIDPKSIHDYVARGWLERVVRGVYRRPVPEGALGDYKESWAIPLLSLQWLMNYTVHLGGESALDMAGYAHYLSLGGRSRVQFYGEVPSWLKRLPMQTEIVVRRHTLFGDDPLGIDDTALEAEGTRPMVDVWRWPLKISSPERAILEALDELPRNTTFENLDKVFEGLASLRPKRLTALLTACTQREDEKAVPCVCRQAPPRMAQAPGHLRDRLRIRTAGPGRGRETSPDLPHLRARGIPAREIASGKRRCLTDTWPRFACF